MKKNMGTIDKVLRILVAIAFVILYFTNVISGVWGIIMLVIAAMFVITSIIGICPAYMPFGISTCKKQE
jgi:hypothetical protein